MTKDTKQILLVGSGIAVLGIIIYMVFAPSGQSSTLSYTSGTVKTNPTNNNSLTNAEIQTGTTLANDLINKFFTPSQPQPTA